MRPTSIPMLALLVTIPAAGCMTGPSAEQLPAVFRASGAEVTVQGGKKRVKGELLEVRDDALVLQRGCEVALVSFRQVYQARVKGVNTGWQGGTPDAGERAQLQLLSRFPKGITPPTMEQLLKCSGRTEPVVLVL